jgi:hypothetical protein
MVLNKNYGNRGPQGSNQWQIQTNSDVKGCPRLSTMVMRYAMILTAVMDVDIRFVILHMSAPDAGWKDMVQMQASVSKRAIIPHQVVQRLQRNLHQKWPDSGVRKSSLIHSLFGGINTHSH